MKQLFYDVVDCLGFVLLRLGKSCVWIFYRILCMGKVFGWLPDCFRKPSVHVELGRWKKYLKLTLVHW